MRRRRSKQMAQRWPGQMWIWLAGQKVAYLLVQKEPRLLAEKAEDRSR